MKVGASASSAIGIFTCSCGESITLPLMLGSGNDFTADFPEGWYPGFSNEVPYIRCPAHNQFLTISPSTGL
jgi:hypothetical protein